MKVDHIGLTTPDIEAALASLAGNLAPVRVRGPLDNVERGVRQAFVSVDGGPTLELLSPLPSTASPIGQHVRNGGGAHHICFAVPDLAAAVRTAQQAGARVVVAPTPDIAFEGRSIAFLMDPLYGLIEFLESDRAKPSGSDCNDQGHAGPNAIFLTSLPVSELDDILADVFTQLFPTLRTTGVAAARLEATPGWDSLGHIRLIISLEQRLGIEIPSDASTRLLDYDSVRSVLTRYWREAKRHGFNEGT